MPPFTVDSVKIDEMKSKFNDLIDALHDHPDMGPVLASIPPQPNRPDGRSVPSVQNSVYFMWDFVNRTNYMFSEIEANLRGDKNAPKMSKNILQEKFGDVQGRNWMSKMLIVDDPDKLVAMCGESADKIPAFGEQIATLATELSEASLAATGD